MSTKKLKVVLNLSKLPVSEKIIRCTVVTAAIAANPSLFAAINPLVLSVNAALSNLKTAVQDAAEGGKHKTAIMHDKEKELEKLMTILANEVEKIANGDEEVVHKAALQIKTYGKVIRPDFEVYQEKDKGVVGLRTKSQDKTIYRWEYSLTGKADDVWIPGAYTDVAHTIISNLEAQKTYWFRVMYISKLGEHPTNSISFAVN